MEKSVDQRKILSKGSVIQLVRYEPVRTNSKEVEQTAKKKQPLLESFVIDGLKGSGSSAVCYEARRISENEQSYRSGILKEFYPVDSDGAAFAVHMDRAESVEDTNRNQLFAKYGTFENFSALRHAYENSYAIITEKRNGSPFAIDLNKYIPHYSFYCGIPSQPENDELDKEIASDNVSFYVWVENEAGYIEFQEYLNDLCKEMQETLKKHANIGNYINDIEYILKCFLELTKCINTLHRFGLYHLDLNPRNFGVQLYSSKVDKNNAVINLYDTNSLYYGMDPNQRVFSSGTKYFRSEEVINAWMDDYGIQSDVYSIGAMLYYALVIKEDDGSFKNVHFCEGTKECSKEAFDKIAVDLANSDLIQSSDEMRSSVIQDKLSLIIKKALNRFGDECGTYRVVGDMTNDIESVLKETIFGKLAAAHPGYKTSLNLVPKEEVYDKTYGAAGAIQKLLLNNPLYDYYFEKEGGEKQRNVLVLGCGAYASEFIDFALELSQIKDCTLHITVATMDSEQRKKDYLAKRESLCDFVAIDGKKSDRYDIEPYGYLDFCKIEKENDKLPDSNKIIETLQENLTQKFSYVFIALNDENLNEATAKACFESGLVDGMKTEDGIKAVVAYVVYGNKRIKRDNDKRDNSILPVNVEETLSDSKEYKFLRQMAFNIHLSWYPDYINDLDGAEREFRKKYNFSSSMENALSLIYKLHSVGIKFDFKNPQAAALQFSKDFPFDEKGKLKGDAWRKYKELVYFEHRRWCLEKITDGWQTMPLDDIHSLISKTKDGRKMRHPCIVPSGTAFGLDDPKWNIKTNKAKWNNQEIPTDELDYLDRLSVEFHRHWSNVINEGKVKTSVLENRSKLVQLASNHQKLAVLCESLSKTMNELFENLDKGNELLSKYKHIVHQIRKYVKENNLEGFTEIIDKLSENMLPYDEYVSYTDWKKKDDKLIRSIRFVLTYDTDMQLCVPLYFEKKNDNTTSRLFLNVASALMLNPGIVTYVVDYDSKIGDEAGLLEALEYANNIVEKHGLQTKFNVKLMIDDRNSLQQDSIEKIKNISRVTVVELLPFKQWRQPDALHEFLMQKSSQRFSAIEMNDTLVSGFLQSANNVSDSEIAAGKKKLPVYRFDAITQRFITDDDSAFLEYVNNKPVLFADDLYASKGKTAQEAKTELYFAYEKAWEIYSGKSNEPHLQNKGASSSAWKKLCAAISDDFDKNCKIAEVRYHDGDFKSDASDYKAFVPDFCRRFLERFLKELADSSYDFFDDYSWKDVASNVAELTVKAPIPCVKGALNSLIRDPMRISQSDLLDIIRLSDGYKVDYKQMVVSDLPLPNDAKKPCLSILKALDKSGLIHLFGKNKMQPDQDVSTVSFVFSGEPMIRLLTSEGYLFELHTYYEALKSGFFDDVSMGVEVTWNGDLGVKNEIDVVLTKGFQTITVECKAMNTIKQEFYYKLYPLAKTFGINTIPVLLVDMDPSANSKNDLEIQRGKELGIVTICDSTNIAQNLKDLFVRSQTPNT